MKHLLLDTDTVSYFLKNVPSVVEQMRGHLEDGFILHLSVITCYEVYNGLYYKNAKKKLKDFEAFKRKCIVLPLTLPIANNAANHYANLRKKGKTIQHTDALIAGTALEHDLQLVTNNTKHYQDINELELDNWK